MFQQLLEGGLLRTNRGGINLVALDLEVMSSNTIVNLTVVQRGGALSSIPATVTALSGTSSVQFVVGTKAVSASTVVQISPSANGATKTAGFTVQ